MTPRELASSMRLNTSSERLNDVALGGRRYALTATCSDDGGDVLVTIARESPGSARARKCICIA